jgi:hypothetical protein
VLVGCDDRRAAAEGRGEGIGNDATCLLQARSYHSSNSAKPFHQFVEREHTMETSLWYVREWGEGESMSLNRTITRRQALYEMVLYH